MDPFENTIANMDHRPMYFRWAGDKLWIYQPMQVFVGRFLQSFVEFPQRQKSASFNVGAIMERMQAAAPVGR
jgi:arylsulfatase